MELVMTLKVENAVSGLKTSSAREIGTGKTNGN